MAARWHQSKRFRLTAGGALLLLAGLLLVPFLVPVDRFRPAIIELLEQETGRKIEIESIRLHLLPKLRLQVANLRVKNPQGFPEGDTLAVERINLGVPLGPLLRRQVQVESLSLRGVTLNLLEDQRGRSNTDLSKVQRAAARKQAAPEKKPLFSLSRVDAVELREVSFSAGTYSRRRKRVQPSYAIAGVNIVLRGLDLRDARWKETFETEMELGGVEISVPSLRQPLRFTDGHVNVKGRAAEGHFTLALGGLRARGKMKMANWEKPRVDFTLAMKKLDVAELAELAAAPEEAPKAQRSAGRSGRRSSGSGQRRLLARGTVKVEKVLFAPFAAENVSGTVRLYTHKLTVDPLEVDFYGGRVEGSLNTDLEKESLPSTLTVTVQGVDVAKLASAAQQGAESKVTGTFDAGVSLRTALGADPLAALTGQGNFSVRDGMLKGFKLEGKRAAMASLLQIEVPSGDTPFRLFAGDLRIQQQRVHSQKVSLEADAMQATMKGSFGFDGTLNYSGTGVLGGDSGEQSQEQSVEEPKRSRNPLASIGKLFGKVAQGTIGRMRVPISVSGTFAEPRFRLAGVPEPVEQTQDQTQATQQEPQPDQQKNLLNLFKRRP